MHIRDHELYKNEGYVIGTSIANTTVWSAEGSGATFGRLKINQQHRQSLCTPHDFTIEFILLD